MVWTPLPTAPRCVKVEEYENNFNEKIRHEYYDDRFKVIWIGV
jgi:hypothetical protein